LKEKTTDYDSHPLADYHLHQAGKQGYYSLDQPVVEEQVVGQATVLPTEQE
jgi:hypothetical protein